MAKFVTQDIFIRIGQYLMSRLIFFIAVMVVVYLLLKSYRSRIPGEHPPKRTEPPPARAEDMVRCVQCGVHLPRSESIMAGGNFYCSEEHRRAHQGAAGKNGG
jgi:uncharacterized protein